MSDTIAIDFETYYHKAVDYTVQRLGSWGYTHHELFDPYMVSVCDGEQVWVGHPRDFNWDSLVGADLVSHNKSFDQAVLHAGIDLGVIPPQAGHYLSWSCSSSMSAYLFNRHSLAEAAFHALGKRVSKAERDKMNGKLWTDLSDEDQDALLKYAIGDATLCYELWDKFSSQWPEQERELANHTVFRGDYGVKINTDLLTHYIWVCQMAKDLIEKSLPWVERGKKPTSSYGVAEECLRCSIPAPPVRDHDEEGFEAWESAWGDRFPWVRNVGFYRSVVKVLGSLETIQARLRPDDTIGFGMKYFGAHTGRWSGDEGLNMQNLRKDPLVFKPGFTIVPPNSEDFRWAVENEEELTKKGWSFVHMRHLFIPRSGKQFCIADLSQIEPRVLAWCCGNTELLDMVRSGLSVYEANARATGNWSGSEELRSGDPKLYKAIKARVLGLGYGCGPEKYQTVAKAMAGLSLTPEQCEAEVNAFRSENKKITDLWKTLDTTFKNSAIRGEKFEIDLPNGRSLRYEAPKKEIVIKKNSNPTPGAPIEKETRYTALVGNRRVNLYGGKLCENLVQAIARDVFAEGILAVEEAGYPVLWHVHDEVIAEVDDGEFGAAMIEQALSQTPEWLPGCPIQAHSTLADHYLKD